MTDREGLLTLLGMASYLDQCDMRGGLRPSDYMNAFTTAAKMTGVMNETRDARTEPPTWDGGPLKNGTYATEPPF